IAGDKPKLQETGFKDEEEIVVTTVEEQEMIEVEDTVTLIIKSAKPQNAGNFHAQLINDAGEATSNKAILTVNRGPVFVKVPEPLAPVNKEETVKLECIVDGTPKPTVSWLINGKELTVKDGVQIEKDVNNNKYTLTIPKANPAVHSGTITIKATNPIGSVQHELKLDILDVPKVAAKLENVSVNEGQDAVFVAKFISNPAPTKIIWLKNDGEEVVASESIEITSTTDETTLKLIGCKATDSGSSYQVKIINQLGEAISNKATLNVSSGPVFITEPTEQKVLKDKEAKFECVVRSNPKPNVIWLLNDKEFTTRDGVRMEKDVAKDKYTLVLPKVTPAHVGKITARATNEFGTAERSCELDVLDAPKLGGKLENITVNEGETAKFVLKISGKPRPTVKWFKDDVELEANESIEIVDVSEDEVALIIKSCKSPESMGNYSAKIINEFGESASNKA
ncbi:immunoglobulin domain-containing protein, partial [Candidatus Saccharibacteria bacterium]|nr:immunoglobulin domain-containing protein [Candidatus Saccharibacteria bacterium]